MQNLEQIAQIDKERIDKIISLLLYEVPQNKIAEAVGLSEARISELKDDEVFQNLMAQRALEFYERDKLFNEGWDAVEENALSVVLQNLQWNKDPDFALRAAAVANKANRRGRHANNGTINAQQAGAAVVINLSQHFVRANREIDGNAPVIEHQSAENKKEVDFLAPNRVEELVGANEGEKEFQFNEQFFNRVIGVNS